MNTGPDCGRQERLTALGAEYEVYIYFGQGLAHDEPCYALSGLMNGFCMVFPGLWPGLWWDGPSGLQSATDGNCGRRGDRGGSALQACEAQRTNKPGSALR